MALNIFILKLSYYPINSRIFKLLKLILNIPLLTVQNWLQN